MTSNNMPLEDQLKHFHLVPGTDIKPEAPVQVCLIRNSDPEAVLAHLYGLCIEQSDKIFHHLVKKAKGTGGKLITPHEAGHNSYPVKHWVSLKKKANRKYDGRLERITDALRFRIIFDDYNQYDKLSNRFLPINNANVLEYEPGIRFDLQKGGFAADQIVLRDPESGLCYEVQIMHKEHHLENKNSHDAYERIRALEARPLDIGTSWRVAANPDRQRKKSNRKAHDRAFIDRMRYSVTYAVTQQDVPVAIIWPCEFERQPSTEDTRLSQLRPWRAKYALTPSLASRTLIDDSALRKTIELALQEEKLSQFQQLPDKGSFMRACQHHYDQNKPRGPKRKQNGAPRPL